MQCVRRLVRGHARRSVVAVAALAALGAPLPRRVEGQASRPPIVLLVRAGLYRGCASFGGYFAEYLPAGFQYVRRPFVRSLPLAVLSDLDDPWGNPTYEDVDHALVPIPEPTGVALLATGLAAGLGATARRRAGRRRDG